VVAQFGWELQWLIDPNDDVGGLRRNILQNDEVIQSEGLNTEHFPDENLRSEDDHAGRIDHIVDFY